MAEVQGKTNFIARFWKHLTVQFTSEGGGISSFLTLFLMFIVFVITICLIFKNSLMLVIPFLIIILFLMNKYFDKFFGLAERNGTQKLFYTPEQRIKALNMEYKYGSDKKVLDIPKENTKLGQPHFANEKVIESGVIMES